MVKAKEEIAPETAEEKQPFVPVIYVGPNIPGGALSRFTVFNNGLTPFVENLKQKHPSVEALLIPVEEYPNRTHELNSQTSPIRLAEKAFVKEYNNK